MLNFRMANLHHEHVANGVGVISSPGTNYTDIYGRAIVQEASGRSESQKLSTFDSSTGTSAGTLGLRGEERKVRLDDAVIQRLHAGHDISAFYLPSHFVSL